MKQQERFDNEVAFQMRNETAKKEVYKNITIIQDVCTVRGEEFPKVIIFNGKSAKPISNYFYRSAERVIESIQAAKDLEDSREEWRNEKKAEKANLGLPSSKVGDLFVSSWGYDQTNVDYYQVIERPSDHYAIVRRIDSKVDSISTSGDYNVSASKGNFSERYPDAMRVKLSKNGGYGESFRVASYANAYSCKESDTRYETGPYNGH